MRPIASVFGLAVAITMCAAACSRSALPQPNIVLILADDLGYGDLVSYGARDLRTPNLDALAASGARFTDAYAASPVCSPSRVALLTGRYPQRFGPGYEDYGTPGLDPAIHPTLAQPLRRAGYATALLGKWNVAGPHEAEFTPNAHGFDYWLGSHANHNYYTHNRVGTQTADFWEDGVPVEIGGYTTTILGNRAVNFIQDQREGRFFLFHSFLTPHYPIQTPRDATVYQRGERSQYVLMLEHMDLQVGRIISALKRRGIYRNTLVIFTSDNGGPVPARNAPFRGGKQQLLEGGIRVPLIVSWPGVIAPGAEIDTPVISMDLTATILAAAHATQDSAAADGIDLLPLLAEGDALPERALYWRRRRATENHRIEARAVREGDWKLLVGDGSAPILYDLRTDPREQNDVQRTFPERTAELASKLASWERSVDR